MTWRDDLEFEPFGPETRESVERLENLIGVRLPNDYREFLLEIGGGYVRDGVADCTEPAPFDGLNITEFHSLKKVVNLLDSTVTPRNMICIGYGHFGMTTCLSIAGLDHGQVFALDTEFKCYWDDETLEKMPHLLPSIKDYFRMRDADELPETPWGYDSCFHVADSFTEFLKKLYKN